MSDLNYGPLRHLIGQWESQGFAGKNRAPDPQRKVENTNFRQEMIFEPIGDVENHEQLLYVLKYSTRAWEEGNENEVFHEELGYFIWDKTNQQVMKSFTIPRGMAINAGGPAAADAQEFTLKADLGSPTYGLSSNKFLDEEFKTLSYEVTFKFSDNGPLTYDENTRIQIKGQERIFDHTEKNTLIKVST